ncbi:hypothetical protein H9Q72_005768 [Fusarium xylarioides]|uniref:Acyl-CoA thioesterase-like C-terminal domain-containing protein n=1 Tax=Fusarium xylarioides TaxID=221167 RepID=A0A9P7HZI2_9HYPO|nr:hypothetical protein H9Q70_006718 [Fusarium xylarioides]KAG5766150.1 hypothetical protein H9Q72_005768 [Fusarium xylarioides]
MDRTAGRFNKTLMRRFKSQVGQISDAEDRRQAQAWLEGTYTFFHEINEEIQMPAEVNPWDNITPEETKYCGCCFEEREKSTLKSVCTNPSCVTEVCTDCANKWSSERRPHATHIGPAVLVVEELRRGRPLSILHITLYQEGLLSESPWIPDKSKKKVAAYVTNTLLNGEQGLGLLRGFELSASPPLVDLTKLATDGDPNWKRLHMVVMDVAPMMQHVEFSSSKYKQTPAATRDLWLHMSNNERWTTWALAYIADVAPALMPTVSVSLDVKKALPKEREEWLRIRISAEVIKSGRYDAEVIVFDRDDDVVALSNHVALVLDGERNWGRKEKL